MMDEKWKLSKSFSTKHSSSATTASSSSNFTRSFSTKGTSTTTPYHSNSPPLRRSSSLKYGGGGGGGGGGSGRFTQKGSSISRKCSNLAKEQKARFYIMRRCVAMLVCWHEHGDP